MKYNLFGFNIDLLSFDEAVNFTLDALSACSVPQAAGKGAETGLHVITINPEIIAAAEKNQELAKIIKNAGLVIPESAGIILALKLKGINREKIPGIEFSKELVKQCAGLNYPIALIGAKEEVLQKAAENLKSEFPNLNIVYKRNGYFDNTDFSEGGIIEEKIINELAASGAKLVLCALGAPKQELFINKCRKIHNNAVYIGIGGSFDVWAGAVKRAPEIWRKLQLEWLYRTIKQPERIKRIYKVLPSFLFRAVIESIF